MVTPVVLECHPVMSHLLTDGVAVSGLFPNHDRFHSIDEVFRFNRAVQIRVETDMVSRSVRRQENLLIPVQIYSLSVRGP